MKICIDAGHYGKVNTGIISGYYESEMNLKLSNYLKTEMEAYGAEVYMTRTDDSDLSLTARGNVAVNNNCDMFLSIHSDASSSASSRGVIAFRSLSHPDSLDLGKRLVAAVCDVMGAPASTAYNATEGCGYREGSAKDGSDYYTVINTARKGCVHVYLLEHSFHTNATDCAFLSDENNLAAIAKAEAAVIADYFGLVETTTYLDANPVYMTLGGMTAGDIVTVSKLLDTLLIPHEVIGGYIYTNIAVTSGDQTSIKALCDKLLVGCRVSDASEQTVERWRIGFATQGDISTFEALLNSLEITYDSADGFITLTMAITDGDVTTLRDKCAELVVPFNIVEVPV